MVDTIPPALIVHAIPGRTRLRIPSRRGDSVFLASLATALSAMAGVQRVAVQAVTGSILLEHTKPLPKLLQAAEEAQLFRLLEPWQQAKRVEPIVFDPKMLIGAGLGVFALWQLTQGRIFPPAITLGWYAAMLTGFHGGHDVPDAGE